MSGRPQAPEEEGADGAATGGISASAMVRRLSRMALTSAWDLSRTIGADAMFAIHRRTQSFVESLSTWPWAWRAAQEGAGNPKQIPRRFVQAAAPARATAVDAEGMVETDAVGSRVELDAAPRSISTSPARPAFDSPERPRLLHRAIPTAPLAATPVDRSMTVAEIAQTTDTPMPATGTATGVNRQPLPQEADPLMSVSSMLQAANPDIPGSTVSSPRPVADRIQRAEADPPLQDRSSERPMATPPVSVMPMMTGGRQPAAAARASARGWAAINEAPAADVQNPSFAPTALATLESSVPSSGAYFRGSPPDAKADPPPHRPALATANRSAARAEHPLARGQRPRPPIPVATAIAQRISTIVSKAPADGAAASTGVARSESPEIARVAGFARRPHDLALAVHFSRPAQPSIEMPALRTPKGGHAEDMTAWPPTPLAHAAPFSSGLTHVDQMAMAPASRSLQAVARQPAETTASLAARPLGESTSKPPQASPAPSLHEAMSSEDSPTVAPTSHVDLPPAMPSKMVSPMSSAMVLAPAPARGHSISAAALSTAAPAVGTIVSSAGVRGSDPVLRKAAVDSAPARAALQALGTASVHDLAAVSRTFAPGDTSERIVYRQVVPSYRVAQLAGSFGFVRGEPRMMIERAAATTGRVSRLAPARNATAAARERTSGSPMPSIALGPAPVTVTASATTGSVPSTGAHDSASIDTLAPWHAHGALDRTPAPLSEHASERWAAVARFSRTPDESTGTPSPTPWQPSVGTPTSPPFPKLSNAIHAPAIMQREVETALKATSSDSPEVPSSSPPQATVDVLHAMPLLSATQPVGAAPSMGGEPIPVSPSTMPLRVLTPPLALRHAAPSPVKGAVMAMPLVHAERRTSVPDAAATLPRAILPHAAAPPGGTALLGMQSTALDLPHAYADATGHSLVQPNPPSPSTRQIDVDALVERAWRTLLERLSIEQERRGLTRWA